MASSESSPFRWFVFVAAAILLIFTVVNALDIGRQPYAGYSDVDNVVNRVRSGSPADQAGFQVGDRILSSGGIDVTNTAALDRRARAAIGETRDYVVERDGAQQTLTLTFAGLTGRDTVLAFCGLIIGLFFLGFGIRPYLARPGGTAKLLAIASLCLALVFIGWPYLASYPLRTALNAIMVPIVFLGLAVLTHFLLAFPPRSPALDRGSRMAILYGPAVVFAAIFLFVILAQPAATGGLMTFLRVGSGLVVGGYFLAALIVMVRNYTHASAEKRRELGLSLMLWLTVVALVPLIVVVAIELVAPRAYLPIFDFTFMTFVLLPIGLATATRRAQQRTEAEIQAPQVA